MAETPRICVTGSGALAPEPLGSMLGGTGRSADVSVAADILSGKPPEATEITAFEAPEGAPTWGFEAVDFHLSDYVPSIKSYIDRCSALGLGAAKLALDRAGLLAEAGRPSEIGLSYATTFGCLDSMELFWAKVKGSNPKFAPPLPFTHAYANSPSSILAIEFRLRGHSVTFSGDVSCGMFAFAHAASAIRNGAGTAILAGASEALSAPRWRHHWSEGELSPDGRWQPLEAPGSTNGIVPGEGAAFLLVETVEQAAGRGASVESLAAGWELVPFGSKRSAADALLNACRRALDEAGAEAGDVSVLCLASPCAGRLAGAEREAMSKLFEGKEWPVACPPKWAGGDALAVSPVWGLVMASGCLAGRVVPGPQVDAAGSPVPPAAPGKPATLALVNMLDPWGQAGAVVLRSGT